MRTNRNVEGVLLLTLLYAGLACQASTPADPVDKASTETPPGVEQLMPRGGIPAVFEPIFVEASAAKLPDDAWVLGVAIGEEARAYSLNLLNSHEVVNDKIGDKNFAAVW